MLEEEDLEEVETVVMPSGVESLGESIGKFGTGREDPQMNRIWSVNTCWRSPKMQK